MQEMPSPQDYGVPSFPSVTGPGFALQPSLAMMMALAVSTGLKGLVFAPGALES